jgi:hypothetical protein
VIFLWSQRAVECADLRFSYRLLSLLVVLLVYMTEPIASLTAQEESRQGKPALPGEPCQTAPHATWTTQEQWVWAQICLGQVADFSTRDAGGVLDPKKPDAWQKRENRVLRPVFLETLLLHQPWRDAVPRHGVRIVGAWFREPLDLSNAELTCALQLVWSRFESEVNLSRLRTPHLLSLDGSAVTGMLSMDNLNVGYNLLMRKGNFVTVHLRSAQITG